MPTGPFSLCLWALLFYAYGLFSLTPTGPPFSTVFMCCIVCLAHDMLSFAIPNYSLSFGAIQIPSFPDTYPMMPLGNWSLHATFSWQKMLKRLVIDQPKDPTLLSDIIDTNTTTTTTTSTTTTTITTNKWATQPLKG